MFDFLGLVTDFAYNILVSIINALLWLYDLLASVALYIWDALSVVAKAALSGLVNIYKGLRWVWDHVIANLLGKLARLISKVHTFLEAKLAPVLRWLRKVRAILDRYYKLYIRPYLQLLQRLRRYLAVLRLLHIKWAEALDRRILQIETSVSRVFLEIRGQLNSLINIVNALTDPPRLARLVLVSVAGRRMFAAVVRMFTGFPVGHFFPSSSPGAQPWERAPQRAKDFTSPILNPSAGTLLAGLIDSPVESLLGGDPTPDAGVLDQFDPPNYFETVVSWYKARDVEAETLTVGLFDVDRALQQREGNVAALCAGAANAFTDMIAR